MRYTQRPADAAKRLAERVGARVRSSGRKWRLAYGGRRWPSAMTGEEVLCRLIEIAHYDLGMSYAEIEGACRFNPGWVLARGHGVHRWVPMVKDTTWCAGPIRRMLRHCSKRPEA